MQRFVPIIHPSYFSPGTWVHSKGYGAGGTTTGRVHLLMSYLSSGLQTARKLDLVDTMMHWLAIGGTLWHGAFTTSTAHTDTVNDVAWHKRGEKGLGTKKLHSLQ